IDEGCGVATEVKSAKRRKRFVRVLLDGQQCTFNRALDELSLTPGHFAGFLKEDERSVDKLIERRLNPLDDLLSGPEELLLERLVRVLLRPPIGDHQVLGIVEHQFVTPVELLIDKVRHVLQQSASGVGDAQGQRYERRTEEAVADSPAL